MITRGSGRCHGPGCQREARVEYFCSEPCQAAWSRQVAGLTVNADVPPGPTTISVPEGSMSGLETLLDHMQANVDEVLAGHPPASGPASSVMEDIQRAYDLVRDIEPPEPVKLTREQWHSLRSSEPERTEWEPGAIGGLLSGVAVVLVETVEESTPYLEQRKRIARAMGDRAGRTHEDGLTPLYQYLPPSGLDATYPLVASPSPQVAQSGQDRGWLGRLWDRWRQA